eukprot:scaffold62478_cov66-Phaeocystis_antarctica.AAC.1
MATVYPAARNLCAAATYEGRARTRTRTQKSRNEGGGGAKAATEPRLARDGPPSEGAATRRCTR